MALLPGTFNMERILWKISTEAAWVRWETFGHTGDTVSEPKRIPPELSDAFEAIDPDVLQGIYYVREAVYAQLASNVIAERSPVCDKMITIDGLRFESIARKVLEHLADEAGLKVEDYDGGLRLDTEGSLDAISKVLALHTVRPANAFGLLRIKCGATSYTDLIGVSDLCIRFKVPSVSTKYSGYAFQVQLTTVVRNGLTGDGVWPKMPMPTEADPDAEDERYSPTERAIITAHFKAELAQRWHPAAIAHPLRGAGWWKLPPSKEALAVAVSIPGPRKCRPARPKAERELEKMQRAEKRAAREEKAVAEAASRVPWRSREERAQRQRV